MSVPESYDPNAPNQHAQLLFDAWEGDLPALHVWLSEKNIDANVMPHVAIRALITHTDDDVSRVARGEEPLDTPPVEAAP